MSQDRARRVQGSRWGRSVREILPAMLTPWVLGGSLLFGMRGQWLGVIGCCLMGGGLAALSLESALQSSSRLVPRASGEPAPRDTESI